MLLIWLSYAICTGFLCPVYLCDVRVHVIWVNQPNAEVKNCFFFPSFYLEISNFDNFTFCAFICIMCVLVIIRMVHRWKWHICWMTGIHIGWDGFWMCFLLLYYFLFPIVHFQVELKQQQVFCSLLFDRQKKKRSKWKEKNEIEFIELVHK